MRIPVLVLLHAIAMAGAVVLLFSGIITAHGKKTKNWLDRHRMMVIMALILVVIGISFMFAFKESISKPHFKTPHSIAGLVTLLFLLTAPVLGTLLIKGKTGLALYHKLSGRIGSILGFITVIFGILILLRIV